LGERDRILVDILYFELSHQALTT